MQPVAIIPARLGSRGIVGKNTRPLCGVSPVVRAARVAREAGCVVVVTSDAVVAEQLGWGCQADTYLYAPAPLHTDTCPMIDVVQDVLARIPGEPTQKILLLQPTQPLREPKHITQALDLLTRDYTSVVSVTELPSAHNPIFALTIDGDLDRLYPWSEHLWDEIPTRRQDADPAYIRDGTVYAFWRDTLQEAGGRYGIYGHAVRPIIIPASETCALDTPKDWQEAERRLQERAI